MRRWRVFRPGLVESIHAAFLFASKLASRQREACISKGDVPVPETTTQHELGDRAAFQLANVTKTPPQYGAITPRWLVRFLDWKPLEAGTLRVNRVADDKAIDVVCGQKDEKALPETYVEYEEKPREYTLRGISAVLDVHTRVSDLYSY